MIHPPVTATIGEYFHTKRGLANGLAFSGASFGGLIFAPIMSALFEDIGYTGTLMIVAGMTFNILITGALLRPIQSFEKRPGNKNKRDGKNISVKAVHDTKESNELLTKENREVFLSSNSIGNGIHKDKNETDEILKQLVLEKENGSLSVIQNRAILQLKAGAPSALKIVRSDSYDQQSERTKVPSSPLLPRTRAWSFGNCRARTFSQNSQKGLSSLNSLVESLSRSRVALYSGVDSICGSVIDIQEIPLENAEIAAENKKKDLKSVFLSKLKASFEISLFKSWVFPIFLLMASMFAPTCGLLPTFLAPLAKDLSLTSDQAGLLMAIVGGVGMGSRIMCALFADRKYVKMTTILAVASATAGVVAHCARFFSSFASLAFMAAILGKIFKK